MKTARYLVCYGDTDQMGVVYYANYLRIFEFSRVIFMRESNLPYAEVEATGVLLPVAEAHVRYLRSAHFEDLLEVDAALVELGRASARFEYRVRRGSEVLARGFTRHACITRQGRMTRLPEAFRQRLQVDSADVLQGSIE